MTAATVSSSLEPIWVHGILWMILLTALGTGVAAVLIARLLEPFRCRLKSEDTVGNMPNAGLWISLCERGGRQQDRSWRRFNRHFMNAVYYLAFKNLIDLIPH